MISYHVNVFFCNIRTNKKHIHTYFQINWMIIQKSKESSKKFGRLDYHKTFNLNDILLHVFFSSSRKVRLTTIMQFWLQHHACTIWHFEKWFINNTPVGSFWLFYTFFWWGIRTWSIYYFTCFFLYVCFMLIFGLVI